MPYRSEAQRRWAHTPSGQKALGKAGVAEFDQASKGMKLPKRTAKKKNTPQKRTDVVVAASYG